MVSVGGRALEKNIPPPRGGRRTGVCINKGRQSSVSVVGVCLDIFGRIEEIHMGRIVYYCGGMWFRWDQ